MREAGFFCFGIFGGVGGGVKMEPARGERERREREREKRGRGWEFFVFTVKPRRFGSLFSKTLRAFFFGESFFSASLCCLSFSREEGEPLACSFDTHEREASTREESSERRKKKSSSSSRSDDDCGDKRRPPTHRSGDSPNSFLRTLSRRNHHRPLSRQRSHGTSF